jgi:hypothetical protein
MGEIYRGREVTGFGVKLTNAGDGLSQAMKIKPKDLQFGDRVMIVVEAVVAKDEHVPAINGDYFGPLKLNFSLKAEAAFFLDDKRVESQMEKHKAQLSREREIDGQQSLVKDMDEDEG